MINGRKVYPLLLLLLALIIAIFVLYAIMAKSFSGLGPIATKPTGADQAGEMVPPRPRSENQEDLTGELEAMSFTDIEAMINGLNDDLDQL